MAARFAWRSRTASPSTPGARCWRPPATRFAPATAAAEAVSEKTSARDELFDLAVERALAYAQRLALDFGSAERLREGLELWYLKTRFAYRVPLGDVVTALLAYPE